MSAQTKKAWQVVQGDTVVIDGAPRLVTYTRRPYVPASCGCCHELDEERITLELEGGECDETFDKDEEIEVHAGGAA